MPGIGKFIGAPSPPWVSILCRPMLIATLFAGLMFVGTISGSDAKSAHHRAQAGSPYAKQCAALWPRYLQADLKMGAEEFGDTRSPDEIQRMHRQFLALCLSQGPNAADIRFLLERY